MAVYKVPQDVEADDKLIGPLTFRQFIFALILVFFLWLTYFMFTIQILLALIPLPFVIFFAALAFPWRKDQPTEVYLTALIHFWTKPRKRIWNQEGHMEHVHITVPKKVEHQYTDGLSNVEVRSRLKSLATTLDTRGWASKNVGAPVPAVAGPAGPAPALPQSDRLVMPKVTAAPANPAMDVTAKDDVLDVANNPVAQNFDNLVNQATEDRKAELLQQMQSGSFPAPAPTPAQPPAAPTATAGDDPSFNPYPDMQQNVVMPSSQQPAQPPAQTPQQPQNQPVPEVDQNAIINLANNSDLNVSTIARQAEQAMQSGDTIELH